MYKGRTQTHSNASASQMNLKQIISVLAAYEDSQKSCVVRLIKERRGLKHQFMPRDTWDNLNLWNTESWCSDTSSRGSLKAGSILPCESFEHLSPKRDRNQKPNLTTELRFQDCLRLFIIHNTSLLVVGACLTWQQAPCLWISQLGNTSLCLNACKHMSLESFSSAFGQESVGKLKLAAKPE